ncbi:Rha family transcriptional regulator [Comamonas sp. CMM02]|uniref:Rha family transcriptional regulator n=1 Tax=Comamonas sp. CMM02 TaxID=2769307 RepID=UPI001785D914|nr:Rha family transcriptional regulator [Comamonas sp. CMM02]MBD9402112.1 Rha family transcriptional regulator [Comamonas sp. CMM02]
MSQSTLALAPSIAVVDGKPTTLSTDVASHFGKQHYNVMRDINNLRAQLDADHALNFEEMVIEVEIGSGATRKDPAYRLTRDGFTLLAMGFTGKKALAFKLAYIDAFNRMEAELQKPAYDPKQIALAHRAALAATAEVYQSVFDAVMQGQDWQLNRYMLRFDATADEGAVARRNAYVMPIERFHSAIEDSMMVDAQTLTQLASTCTTRLGRMAARNTVAGTQGSLQLR